MKYLRTVAKDKVIKSLYSLSRNIKFQVFTNNNQVCKNLLLHKKAKSYSHWVVTITSETVNLDQLECRKINSPPQEFMLKLFVNLPMLSPQTCIYIHGLQWPFLYHLEHTTSTPETETYS